MKRDGRLRPVGRRKQRLRDAGMVDGPLAKYVRGHDCDVPGCTRAGWAHHVTEGTSRLDWRVMDRSAEGIATEMEGCVCSLCLTHHNVYHDQAGGVELFREWTGCDVRVAAQWWGNRFKRERPDEYRRLLRSA